MNKKNQVLLNQIYKISFTIFTIILGLAFVILSYTILTKGQEHIQTNPSYIIYNKDIISTYLSYLLIPFVLWILLIIGGFVISLFYKVDKKEKHTINPVDTYRILRKKLSNIDEEHSLVLKKERTKRTLIFTVISIISLLLMIFPARYLFNTNNFSGIDTNKEMTMMMLNVFPFIIGAFLLFGGYIIYFLKSIKKETLLMKDLLKVIQINQTPIKETNILPINIVRGVILITSITFITIGLLNGGYGDVLNKAVNICKECIGLA